MAQWRVTQQQSGTKLIAFLCEKLEFRYSARFLKRSIEGNLCSINGRIERFGSTVLGKGDIVEFLLDGPLQSSIQEAPKILYRDADLVIIDKPAGISSDDPALIDKLDFIGAPLLLVHRLDRETSGALIFAHTPKIVKSMIELFRERKVKKKYLAIVDGIPKSHGGIIKNPLAKLYVYQGQSFWGRVKHGDGLPAETEWSILNRSSDCALIACVPLTGRTHQIRVHLSGIGHPILGDKQYGKHFICPLRPRRCLLHAYELAFPHPKSSSPVSIRAELPNDFLAVLEAVKLRLPP